MEQQAREVNELLIDELMFPSNCPMNFAETFEMLLKHKLGPFQLS